MSFGSTNARKGSSFGKAVVVAVGSLILAIFLAIGLGGKFGTAFAANAVAPGTEKGLPTTYVKVTSVDQLQTGKDYLITYSYQNGSSWDTYALSTNTAYNPNQESGATGNTAGNINGITGSPENSSAAPLVYAPTSNALTPYPSQFEGATVTINVAGTADTGAQEYYGSKLLIGAYGLKWLGGGYNTKFTTATGSATGNLMLKYSGDSSNGYWTIYTYEAGKPDSPVNYIGFNSTGTNDAGGDAATAFGFQPVTTEGDNTQLDIWMETTDYGMAAYSMNLDPNVANGYFPGTESWSNPTSGTVTVDFAGDQTLSWYKNGSNAAFRQYLIMNQLFKAGDTVEIDDLFPVATNDDDTQNVDFIMWFQKDPYSEEPDYSFFNPGESYLYSGTPGNAKSVDAVWAIWSNLWSKENPYYNEVYDGNPHYPDDVEYEYSYNSDEKTLEKFLAAMDKHINEKQTTTLSEVSDNGDASGASYSSGDDIAVFADTVPSQFSILQGSPEDLPFVWGDTDWSNANAESYSFDLSPGAQTNAGTYEYDCEIQYDRTVAGTPTSAKQSNIVQSPEASTYMVIKKRPIIIEQTITVPYNFKEQTIEFGPSAGAGIEITGLGLATASGDELVSVGASITAMEPDSYHLTSDLGQQDVDGAVSFTNPDFVIKNAKGVDVTDNYEITYDLNLNIVPLDNTLLITKKVLGDVTDAQAATYTFEVTGPAEAEENGPFATDDDHPDATFELTEDGQASTTTVTVTGADSMYITGLVAGEYSVKEVDPPKYEGYQLVTTYDPTNRTVTIGNDNYEQVTVTNNYTKPTNPGKEELAAPMTEPGKGPGADMVPTGDQNLPLIVILIVVAIASLAAILYAVRRGTRKKPKHAR